jgi:MFS family permease
MSTPPVTSAAPGPSDGTDPAPTPSTAPPPVSPATQGRWRGFRALHWPGFRIYFVGMLFRGLAMWMPLVSLPWLAVELGATPAEIGLITGCFYLPTFFVGPLGGVLADRVQRRNVLVAAQLGAAGLGASMCLLILAGWLTLPILAAASFGFGLIIAIEVPVRQSYMTELVPRTDISSAASLHATAWNSTRLVGPVIAGLLIALVGSASPFLFASVVSVVVAFSFLWMDRYREPGRQRVDRSQSILADLRGGASFAIREPAVRWSLILIWTTAMFGLAMFSTLAPIYAPQELGLGADGYGAFLGAAGAGALVAAILVTAFAHGDRRPWLSVGVMAMALLLAAIAVASSPEVVFVLAFLFGAAQITIAQNALVSVHSATPDALRGRVMGLWVTMFQGSSLFGAVLAGGLADVLGTRVAMLLGAMALAGLGLYAVVAIRRVSWRAAPAAAPSA